MRRRPMMSESKGSVLVSGATGFIGSALARELVRRGQPVVALTRRPTEASARDGIEWRTCDLLEPSTLQAAFAGVRVAYYLVHSMGSGGSDFGALERQAALAFAQAAARADVKRIVYLGGPALPGAPSEHLRSRLAVGEILRRGTVPAVELRASMVIGRG